MILFYEKAYVFQIYNKIYKIYTNSYMLKLNEFGFYIEPFISFEVIPLKLTKYK